MVKPKVSEIIKHRMPDWVAEKEQFVNFIQYYYEWLENKSKPLDFLRNIVEYGDIDETSEEFIDLIIGKITSFIPNNSAIDKKFLAKNIRSFIRSKGSDESLQFIMRGIFGEDAYRLNMSEYVLRPSDNEYIQEGYIAIEVNSPDTDFSECLGSTLIQLQNPSSLTIQEATYQVLPNGRMFWVLRFDPRNINGQFEIGQEVKAIKRSSDPTFIEIQHYETVVGYDFTSPVKTLRVISEIPLTTYDGIIIENLDDTFVGTISGVQQYALINDKHDYTFILSEHTGTPTIGEKVYLITAAEADSHLNLNDFCFGVIANSIGDFDHIHESSGYYSGLPVEFRNGSGLGIVGEIGDVSPGGVEKVIVLNGGANYKVGDPVYVDDKESGGYGFEAHVSNIDGYGAEIHAVMEIDKIVVRDGGTGYAVGDTFSVSHLENLIPDQKVIWQVASITSSNNNITKWNILNSGQNYNFMSPVLVLASDVTYSGGALSLVDNTIVPITGYTFKPYTPFNRNPAAEYFAQNSSLNNFATSVIDVEIVTPPSASVNNISSYLVYNGFGAVLTPNIVGGQIQTVTVNKSGINYIDPAIKITASIGSGASFKIVKDGDGKITSVTPITTGNEYNGTVTLTMYDRAGQGFVAQAICEVTGSKGAISGVTLTTNNEWAVLPPLSENVPYETVTSASGYGAKFDILYKVKRLDVANQGSGYKLAGTCVVDTTYGIGRGLVLYPVIDGGSLENVIIVDGGENYAPNSTITFGGGSGATGNLIVQNGKVVTVDITATGSGYTTGNFTYDVDPVGAGAAQAPVVGTVTIDGDGKLLSVLVSEPGRGYTQGSTAVYVDGDFDVAPVMNVNVFTGVDSIGVENSSKPSAFNISPNDKWVDVKDPAGNLQTLQLRTGTIIESGGPAGTGGEVSYYVNKQGGLAYYGADKTPYIWISNTGTGYVSPVLQLGNSGVTANYPIIKLSCSRKIESVNVTTPGSGINQNTQLIVAGSGQGAVLTPIIDGAGGISTITISNAANTNKGYVTVPKITVDDNSTVGAISEVTVTNPGSGFRKFPILKCNVYKTEIEIGPSGDRVTTITGIDPTNRPDPAFGARLLAVSDTIGAIRSVSQSKFGYGYDEVPDVVYPMVCIVDSTSGFKTGDNVVSEFGNALPIGPKIIKVVSTGSNLCELHLEENPTALSMFPRQTVDFNASNVPLTLQNTIATVVKTNAFNNIAILQFPTSIPVGDYVFNDSSDVDLLPKTAKVLSVDPARNMIWINDIDNIYDYEQELNYIAEGGSNEGKFITTEYAVNITMHMKLKNIRNDAASNVLWMSHAHSFAKQTAIGRTRKHFTSTKGMVNSRGMRVQNSVDVQDYSLEVHTGLSLNDYSRILKETVHPAGYYLSGVFEDTNYIIDQLRMNLPLSEGGRSADFVALGIAAAWASLYYVRNYSLSESKEMFKKRFDGLSLSENSIPIFNAKIQDFDIWQYPENNVWHNKSESDQRDYTIWWGNAEPVHLITKANAAKTGTFGQTTFTATVAATAHGYKVDDWVFFGGGYYKVATVPNANSFTATGLKSQSVAGGTACTILKAYDGGFPCAYTRASNLLTVTHTAHGLISSINTWVYVDIPTTNVANQLEYKASYCRVTSVTNANTFVIDTKSTVGAASGTLRYWRPQDVTPKFDDQIRLTNVAYTDNGATITITGLPDTHTLMVGNILYATWGSSDAFVTISSITTTTVTFNDPGITGALNISFTMGQSLPPQPGYGSLTEYIY